MRRQAGWALLGLALALAGLSALATAGQATGPDVVAAEPHEGDLATYEGYERVTENRFEVANRSLDHVREWTVETRPLADGSVRPVPTLAYRFPAPDPANASTSTPGLVPETLSELVTSEGPPDVETRLVELDRHFTRLPAAPAGFSVGVLDEHREGQFWRMFRLHVSQDGWCAQAPLGTLVDRGPDEAQPAARRCLETLAVGEAEDVRLDAEFRETARWGTVWTLEARVDYHTSEGHTGHLDVAMTTTPRASMELSRTLTWTTHEPDRTVQRTRHLEMTGFERGDEPMPDEGPDPARPTVDQVPWTREGPASDWQPELGFGEARAAAEDSPTWQDYRSEHPAANLRLAYFFDRHTDERSTPSTSTANLAHCRNPLVPRTPPVQQTAQQGWMLQWSGEGEDALALVHEPSQAPTPGPVDAPETTQVTTYTSKPRQPGLDLPGTGPDPGDLLGHADLVDELGARGDRYAAVLATGLNTTDADTGQAPLMGMTGRQRCTYNAATGAYGLEDRGLVFWNGTAAGVYSLTVEAVDDQRAALASTPAPPSAGGDASRPEGFEWAGVALAASAATWAAGRGVAGLYSRLTRRELLDDPTRKRLHELVHEEPGVGLTELALSIDKHRSTLAYHLDRLEEEGFLETRTTESGRVAFPPGSPLVEHASILARGQARALVHAVQNEPGLHLSAYADELGVSKGYVSRLADPLADAGLLERREEGRKLLLQPGPHAAAVDPSP